MNKTILCIEDNIQVQTLNKSMLEAKGFTVKLAMSLKEAREIISQEMPDLIILDIHLPDGNGLDFLRELRKTSSVLVIALTNNKEERDIVEGFASGCDDYIPKPYTFPILYARIEARLRRAAILPDIITKGALLIKVSSDEAFVNGENLLLTKKEFSLLCMLVQDENRTFSGEYLYEKVWGTPLIGDTQALSSSIKRLRKKLTNSGYSISTEYGSGYRFEKVEP